jgi:hypothetical protein
MSLVKEMLEWTFEYIKSIPYNSEIRNDIYYALPKTKSEEGRRSYRSEADALRDKHHAYQSSNIPSNAIGFHYIKRIETHGRAGGNCWGTGNAEPYHNDIPDDFNFGDYTIKLCHEFCPTITFINYMLLLDECIVTEDYEIHEYYGNMTGYRLKSLDIGKLAKRIEESV